jgi:predicted metal-dependent hydrolase
MNNITIKKSRTTKRLRIAVHADGRVVVSAPRLLPDIFVRRFIRSRAGWINEKVEYFKSRPTPPGFSIKSRMTRENKEKASALVHARLKNFNQFYNFTYNKVTVRNQKTRWGSCSRRGNLNFNYRIIFLKPELQDYIVVHELCHLKEHNHSVRFWSLVEQQIPDWKELKRGLRGN